MRIARVVAAVALLAAGGAGSAGAQVTVYSNGFDTNTNGVTGFVSSIPYPSGCTSAIVDCAGSFLGYGDGNPFSGAQTFSISLAGLPTHTGLRIGFDYLALLSMDGSTFGPDGFSLVGDGTTLINATFANYPFQSQNYCPPTSVGDDTSLCAPQTGAAEVNTLGYATVPYNTFCCNVGDALYQLSFTLPHTASTATFAFTTFTNQPWSDEGMGFDNISIQALGVPSTAAPEPATSALLAIGLVGLGAITRRRRA